MCNNMGICKLSGKGGEVLIPVDIGNGKDCNSGGVLMSS